jgi:hypothetical protein
MGFAYGAVKRCEVAVPVHVVGCQSQAGRVLLGLPGARNWKLFFHHRNGRLLNLDQPIASDDCKAPSDVDGSDNQTSPPSSTTTTTTTTASSSSSSSSWETVPPLDDLDALLSEPADEEDQSVYDQELRHVFGDQWDNLVYLSPDSPNVLQTINPDDIYILGGIADHNRLKVRSNIEVHLATVLR